MECLLTLYSPNNLEGCCIIECLLPPHSLTNLKGYWGHIHFAITTMASNRVKSVDSGTGPLLVSFCINLSPPLLQNRS